MTHIPRGGILTSHHAFDLSISKRRREGNHLFLLILTIIFCPGMGILIFFFRKCQNPHPMPDPPPLGLDIDRCITGSIKKQETVLNLKIIAVNHRKLYITNVASSLTAFFNSLRIVIESNSLGKESHTLALMKVVDFKPDFDLPP